MSLVDQVRRQVYDIAMRTGTPPLAATMAKALGISRDQILDALRQLAESRILVLQPGSGEILMAAPFSAVPTPFVVGNAYANCIWDALGIPAMLGHDARIDTSCADCGTAAVMFVEGGAVRGDGLVHFAIPARDWWKDIVFT